MKKLLLAASIIAMSLTATAQAEDKWQKVDGMAIVCTDFFAAREMDKLLDAGAISVIQSKINERGSSCVSAKQGLEYIFIKDFYDAKMYFTEVYVRVDGDMIKAYMFDF